MQHKGLSFNQNTNKTNIKMTELKSMDKPRKGTERKEDESQPNTTKDGDVSCSGECTSSAPLWCSFSQLRCPGI